MLSLFFLHVYAVKKNAHGNFMKNIFIVVLAFNYVWIEQQSA